MKSIVINGRTRYFGSLKSKPDSRDYTIAKIMKEETPLPEEYIKEYKHAVKDQGEVGKCVCMTVAYHSEEFEEEKTGKFVEMSSDELYADRKKTDWQGIGTEPREVNANWLHDGNVTLNDFDFPGTEYPDILKFFNFFKYKLLRIAYKHRIKAYYRLNNDDEIKAAFYKGMKVTICIPVFANIGLVGPDGVIPMPPEGAKAEENDPNYIGDHAIKYEGWTKDPAKEKRIINSWNEFWGDKGHGYLPKDYPINEAWAYEYNAQFKLYEYVTRILREVIYYIFRF